MMTELTLRMSLAATVVVGLLSLLVLLGGFTIDLTIIFGTGGDQAFSPLHTYFMSPTGSDSNNGTTTSTPWASPNHAVVCGDVIIAQAGTYKGDMGTWGTVSGCPSTSGGIDGNGGIYAAVLVCGGSDITACKIDCSVAPTPCNGESGFGPSAAININDKSNWAVEGWSLTCGGTTNCTAFQPSGCTVNAVYVFFINNLTFNNGQSWATQDCLSSTFGPDYQAAVGNIAQNSAQNSNGICISALDIIRPGKSDADTTHTHFFIYNNYAYNNLVPGCDTQFDGEDYMIDTPDGHNIAGHVVFANNVGFYAERYCINTTGGTMSNNPIIKIYNNTCTLNNERGVAGTAGGELQQTASWTPTGPSVQIWNNIAYASWGTPPGPNGSGTVYAEVINPANPLKIGSQVRVGAENIIHGTPSPANDCAAFNGPTCGGDTSVNPDFKNTTDLTTNHLGVPSCTGFTNTTQCMGWNAATKTMTSLSILDDLTANATGGCTQCAGKGFQKGNTTCVTSGDLFNDYPAYLKGIVYLQASGFVNGATITEKGDLATKPCGM